MFSCFSCVRMFVTLWTVAHQAPLSMGFSRQEYWSGFPCLFSRRSFQSRDRTNVSCISCIAGRFLTTEAFGKTGCRMGFSSVTQPCSTLCNPMDCSTPGFPAPQQLLELTPTLIHWVGDAIQPSHPHPLFILPAFNLAQHQGFFQWVSSSHQVDKVLEFQLQHRPSSEYSGLISFRIDWLDLLAVQGTLKSLLQHHCSKALFLWCSAFFIVRLSRPYITTGKTIALTRWTFVDKVMSLLFNILSRFVIAFLPRSKRLLISWLQSPSAVILSPPK